MPKSLGLNPALKFFIYLVFFVALYFFLPIYLAKIISGTQIVALIFFCFINTAVVYFILRKYYAKNYLIDWRIQQLHEKTNLLSAEHSDKQMYNMALKENSLRINSLKDILEKLNQSLELDTVAEALVDNAFSLVAHNKGDCLLYLVEPSNQKLYLFKTKKEDPGVVIKTKEGNIFDFWVSRHATPLLIEDIKNDFRFDPEKAVSMDQRKVLSLVSAPLISQNKFLGIIRLDNPVANFYSQDDLRFLVAISDLGAVALENSELFKKTQDLAIHDALTSLYAKGYFLERLKEEFTRCRRNDIPLALLLLDIDYFKNYNDEFGHTAGDIVLKKVSKTIADSLANLNPVISRFGGEEFCAVLSGIQEDKIASIAESLRLAIEKENIVLRRVDTHITASIGLVLLNDDVVDEEDLIRRADKAMYTAKQKGRNRVCCI
jgi:diguanylate cyclase (GGDEF)-like protein